MSNRLENRQLGAYRLISRLGKGRVAEVWLANQLTLDREVALKIIPQVSSQPTVVERFRREAQALARLDHPHILPVIDYGNAEGLLYLVTPYIRGGNLQQRLERETLTRGHAFGLFGQILDGLNFVHQHGIIHRDLKPANILLHPDGRAVIADFGVARLESENLALTQSGMMLGSPQYMAPEQFIGQADYRSDLYALGVLLYQLLTGQVPYTGNSAYEIGIHHLKDPLPLPDRLVPPALEGFLAKALDKRPEQRFGSAAQMQQAFRQAIQGVPPAELAVRPPRPENGENAATFQEQIFPAQLLAGPATLPRPGQPVRETEVERVAVQPAQAAPVPAKSRSKKNGWWLPLGVVMLLLLAVGLAVLFVRLTSGANSSGIASLPNLTAASPTTGTVNRPTSPATTRATSPVNSTATVPASRVAGAAATPASPTTATTGRTLTVQLEPMNGTAAFGTAVFSDQGNGTTGLQLKMSALGEGRHDVFIRQGSCQAEGNDSYQLPSLQAGADGEASLTTSLKVDFATLVKAGLVLSVLNNNGELFFTASCGPLAPASGAGNSRLGLVDREKA